MPAGILNLPKIEAGALFEKIVELDPNNPTSAIDYTSATHKATLQNVAKSTFTQTITVETLGPRKFRLSILPADTEKLICGPTLDDDKSQYIWQWYITPGDSTTTFRFLEGTAAVSREIP